MILSILIPTLPERKDKLAILLKELKRQIGDNKKIEVLIDDRGRKITTGQKRNELIRKASGKYVWQIDDDDHIHKNAIKLILKAIKKNPDVIGINGYMTTDGRNIVNFEIRLGNPYVSMYKEGEEVYLRFPNHITPMKRKFALIFKFPHKTLGEDYHWAKKLHDSGVMKTQEIINKPIYHYDWKT